MLSVWKLLTVQRQTKDVMYHTVIKIRSYGQSFFDTACSVKKAYACVHENIFKMYIVKLIWQNKMPHVNRYRISWKERTNNYEDVDRKFAEIKGDYLNKESVA